MQTKLIGGIAVLVLVIGAFFFGRDTGIDSVNAKLVSLTSKTLKLRQKAENVIIQEKVIWRDRIRTIEKAPDTCLIPADILRVLHDSGIYVGPM